jgi:predicted dehydrogenase
MDFATVSEVSSDVKWHPQGSDETVTSYFTVGTAKAGALTSMNTPSTLYLEVTGDKGSVELLGNDAFNSHNKASSLKVIVDGTERIEEFEECDPYMLMADAFADRVQGRSAWLLPHEQSIAFAELFDRIFASMERS